MPDAATQTLVEADNNYIGFNSRLDPSNLPPGYAQYAQNMRMQRGTAQPRKGTKRLTQTELNPLTMVGSGAYQNAAGQDNIVLVFSDRMYLYNTETNLLSSAYYFPTGRTIAFGGACDVVQALNKIYIFRGKYDKTTFSATMSNSAIASGATGTITITTINPHGYSTGDEVTVLHGTVSTEASLNGSKIITVTSPSSFTFQFTNTGGSTFQAHTNHPNFTARRGKPPLIWDGVTTPLSFAEQNYIQSGGNFTTFTVSVPCGDFGIYFQNRLCIKYDDYQIAVSDILEEVCDLSLNNFVVNQGGNDQIVGFLPWIENQFLVFMEKSIFIVFVETTSYITGQSPGVNSTVTVVTTQVGCLARKSIVSAGQFVFFLSGKGVHMLTPQLDLKLIGQTLPLSEPVDDFFDQVNFTAASNASAVYYDNRFFISLPTNSATRNNKTLVYNTLNQAWESVDTYPSVTDGGITYTMYQDDWQVCQYGGKRRLFLLTRFNGITSYGGIFLTEELDGGDEFKGINGSPVLPFVLPSKIETLESQTVLIDARIRSREYTFNNIQGKRFSRAESQFNNSSGNIISMIARTHDPDAVETVATYTFSGSTTADSTVRPRIAMRGSTIDIETVFLKGRPQLKGGVVYAIVANRNMETQE